ncbi:MAG: GIY-YIG nuclease family protein [Gammaproteobacteria bacterium]
MAAAVATLPGWHVYLIKTRTGKLYTGITTDIARRLSEHSQSGSRAAKYLRGKAPLQILYSCEIGSRSLAMQVEWQIKQLPRTEKQTLIANQPDRETLIAALLSAVVQE